MKNDLEIDWHNRFQNQLKWTSELRHNIYNLIKLSNYPPEARVLEIGCGTGALLLELGTKYSLKLFGIDVDAERLVMAKQNLNKMGIKAELSLMNIETSTFPDGAFDLIVTNLVFLWINDLDKAFEQLHRILKKGGFLLILTEPDYGGLIEYPETGVKDALISNLKELGADPEVGRKLNGYFSKNNKFSVFQQYSSSVPWIANSLTMKKSLKLELDFFKNLLGKDKFNTNQMKESIDKGDYFLYNPAFSYILKKC